MVVVTLPPLPVAAHRGASGYRPEHSLGAFALGLALGASHLEVDLVPTRDGELVVRHDAGLSRTTDVARHRGFAGRRTTRLVDGVPHDDWFVEDFTLEELRSLTVRERWPRLRPGSAQHDGLWPVATFEEVLDLAATTGCGPVGVLAELKHVARFRGLGLPVDEMLLDVLRRRRLDHPASGVSVMAFEDAPLRSLRARTGVPLVRLVDRPEDVSADRLGALAGLVDAVGVAKPVLLGRPGRRRRGERLVREAGRRGMSVWAWTVRAENRFLEAESRTGDGRRAHGDVAGEVRRLLDLGVAGLVTDHPDLVLAAAGSRVRAGSAA